MLRQSLGSPSSKVVKDEQLLLSEHSSDECKDEEEGEEEQLKKLKHKTAMPETYIHLIPMLTFLCFLILYLSSHDPADLGNFKSLSDPSDSELQQMAEIKKGDILAIRSLKNLKQEAEAAKHRRLHRKIPQF